MNIKYKILSIALVFAIFSCNTEEFLDINTNPNTLPTASPNFVFSNAQNVTASNLQGPNETGSYWAGQWTQSNGYIISTTLFAYNFTNGDFNYWDGIYDNLQDYQFVIENADKYSQKFLSGPSKIMQVYNYQILVDLYGNIPFSDALKNVNSLAPKFDDQKLVYDNLIKTLDEAIVETKANVFGSAFIGSDLMFRGNTTKWVKFANSLKLRILMRQSKMAGKDAFIKTELNKIASEGSGFITGEDVGSGGTSFYLPTAGKLNPFYERFGYNATGGKQALNNYPRVTDFLIKSLKASGDTLRMKRIAYATGGENGSSPGVSVKAELAVNYVGTPFGASSGYLPANTSSIGPSLLVKNEYARPVILMTAAEIQLNLAEAKQLYGSGINLTGTAQDYFEEGLRQSFRVLGTPAAGADKFKGSKVQNYDFDASTNKINAIAYQKWLALCNFSGLEAWNEYRKTGLPVTPQSVQVPETKRPTRLYYPNTEAGSNTVNVEAQGKIDVFTSKIFWDID